MIILAISDNTYASKKYLFHTLRHNTVVIPQIKVPPTWFQVSLVVQYLANTDLVPCQSLIALSSYALGFYLKSLKKIIAIEFGINTCTISYLL
jgi:hypothetical protein